ncbi:hypothetical protein CFS9_12210 [Flavobacterium sp. CFS9]|uniref:Outer membrane protein beta-barrel domain-containing protein n=1 Tax=Flavobacterium sp. CFS9 TaxID=3143118 RepID=A0AAT9GZE0_9FLAO
MKKSIIVCAIFLTISSIAVNAQETGKHELNVTYSDGIPMTFREGFTEILSSAFLGQKPDRITSFGNVGLGYRNQITERIRVGGDLAFQQEQIEQIDKNNKPVAKRTNLYFMAMPVLSFSYIKTEWLDFYGSAAAGVILNKYTKKAPNEVITKDNTIDFAFQVNPAGLRIGKKFGGFVEAGFGHRGIISAGLNYKF